MAWEVSQEAILFCDFSGSRLHIPALAALEMDCAKSTLPLPRLHLVSVSVQQQGTAGKQTSAASHFFPASPLPVPSTPVLFLTPS